MTRSVFMQSFWLLTCLCVMVTVIGCKQVAQDYQSVGPVSETNPQQRIDRVVGIKLTPADDTGSMYWVTIMVQDDPKNSSLYRLLHISVAVKNILVQTDLPPDELAYVTVQGKCSLVNGSCVAVDPVTLTVHSLAEVH